VARGARADASRASTPAPAQLTVEGRVLTLADALSATLAHDPDLSASLLETRAREAETLQAAAHPNPELRGDLENVGGSGSRGAADESETTLLLSQRIQLGGKRAKGERVAARRQELSVWDYEAHRLEALAATTKAFVATLVAQERVALAEELERLDRDALSAAERSAGAGASSALDATRARVALGRAAIERSRAARSLDAARAELAARWGDTRAGFNRVTGDLALPAQIPDLDALLGELQRNPDLARWQSEHGERTATLALEEAERVPDVTLGAGGRYFNDDEDAALVFEVAVPLPIFDRNAGAIAAARSRVAKAQAEERAAAAGAASALRTAHARLVSAHEQASALREHVLADAEASRRNALGAYRSGALRLLDVLDTQRTVFELRAQYLDAVEEFHAAAADIERLTARPLAGAMGETR
jgi:cobalt-zinc-cadmium efflux system outer membrane protein